MPIEEPPFIMPMPLKAGGPLGERKQGSPCPFVGCHFVSLGRDIAEMRYDMEMHVRDNHYRDSRANYRLARRGLMDHVFPPPGQPAGPPPTLVPAPPTYAPPPGLVYRQRALARTVA
jgi:hypothetical protein